MNSNLRNLVAQWRDAADTKESAFGWRSTMRNCADELEAELNALSASDTQPLTDKMIVIAANAYVTAEAQETGTVTANYHARKCMGIALAAVRDRIAQQAQPEACEALLVPTRDWRCTLPKGHEHNCEGWAQPVSDTDKLVDRFAVALKDKLRAAEAKYGWNDGWKSDDWQIGLAARIREHVEKGDPRDVAAYCAFAWHHGWSLANPAGPGPAQEPKCEHGETARHSWFDENEANTEPGAVLHKCPGPAQENDHEPTREQIVAAAEFEALGLEGKERDDAIDSFMEGVHWLQCWRNRIAQQAQPEVSCRCNKASGYCFCAHPAPTQQAKPKAGSDPHNYWTDDPNCPKCATRGAQKPKEGDNTEETFEAYLRRKWPQFNGQNGALDFEQFILCAIEAWWKMSSAQRCEIVDQIRKSPGQENDHE